MTTLENNISKLVEKGIISIDFPKMGGILIVRSGKTLVKFDKREYYEGRGAKYNKNINHEEVCIKITQKEVAEAMRHFKARNKKIELTRAALAKQETKGNGNYHWRMPLKYYKTKASTLYFPKFKEISRIKVR